MAVLMAIYPIIPNAYNICFGNLSFIALIGEIEKTTKEATPISKDVIMRLNTLYKKNWPKSILK